MTGCQKASQIFAPWRPRADKGQLLVRRRPGAPPHVLAALDSRFRGSDDELLMTLRWGGDGALVVHDLSHLRPLLVAQRGRVDAQVVAGLHAALDGGAVADFVEPALEMLELTDVL